MVTKAEDILYGRNGTVTLVSGDTTDIAATGTLATANNIEARVEVQNTQIMLPKQFATRLRRIGWAGTGTLRIYRHNAAFFTIMRQMINPESPVPVFELYMTLENKDPGSTNDVDEDIILKDLKFWTFDWMFNMNDFVELPLSFTFEDIEYEDNLDSSRNLGINNINA